MNRATTFSMRPTHAQLREMLGNAANGPEGDIRQLASHALIRICELEDDARINQEDYDNLRARYSRLIVALDEQIQALRKLRRAAAGEDS